MRKFILGLLLLFTVSGMAIHVHHVHHIPHHFHHVPHHSSHRNHVTTQTKKVQSHKVRPITKRHTSVSNTFWRNGILYYIILNPRREHVYDNGLVLCEGCNKVLVKKGAKYCSKCRRIKRLKTKVMKANEAPEKIYLIRNISTPTSLNTTLGTCREYDNFVKFMKK